MCHTPEFRKESVGGILLDSRLRVLEIVGIEILKEHHLRGALLLNAGVLFFLRPLNGVLLDDFLLTALKLCGVDFLNLLLRLASLLHFHLIFLLLRGVSACPACHHSQGKA